MSDTPLILTVASLWVMRIRLEMAHPGTGPLPDPVGLSRRLARLERAGVHVVSGDLPSVPLKDALTLI